MKKRLLVIAVIGAALVLSTVMIVSLRGNDKPEITTNPPTDEEQPASTPQPAVYTFDSYDEYKANKPHHEVAPSDSEEEDDDEGNGNGNGNGNGQSDADKTHGLERAIEVHLRNMEKKDAKMNENAMSHDSNGNGQENSLAQLQDNLEKQESRGNADSANAQTHNT